MTTGAAATAAGPRASRIYRKAWRRILGDANEEKRHVDHCLWAMRKTLEEKAAAELGSLEVAPAETVDLELDSDCDVGID